MANATSQQGKNETPTQLDNLKVAEASNRCSPPVYVQLSKLHKKLPCFRRRYGAKHGEDSAHLQNIKIRVSATLKTAVFSFQPRWIRHQMRADGVRSAQERGSKIMGYAQLVVEVETDLEGHLCDRARPTLPLRWRTSGQECRKIAKRELSAISLSTGRLGIGFLEMYFFISALDLSNRRGPDCAERRKGQFCPKFVFIPTSFKAA